MTPYLEQLGALPFVRGVKQRRPGPRAHKADTLIELATPTGKHSLAVEEKRSHLTRTAADHLIAQQKLRPNLILFAPQVGRELGDALAAGHVQFMDLAGNCFVQLGDAYIARIQGKTAMKTALRDRALRAPSYRVTFALLAQPSLLNATARTLATAAGGISPQTAADVRERFFASYAVGTATRQFRWAESIRRTLLNLWIGGASTTLYPHLLLGRYRARERDLAKFEAMAAERLTGARWAWGGAAAAHRLTGFYRGTSTVLYVDTGRDDTSLARKLELVPDADGPVVLMRPPGPLAFEGPEGTAHPLLVYTDLLHENEARAHEAAFVFADKFMREDFVR